MAFTLTPRHRKNGLLLPPGKKSSGAELGAIIPADRVPRYMFYRQLEADKIRSKNRKHAGVQPALFLPAAISTFHSQISDLLAAIEKTDANDEVHDSHGRWLTISKFLTEKRAANDNVENPRHLIANTDNIQRIRRMNSQNELTYLYLESELAQVAELAKVAQAA